MPQFRSSLRILIGAALISCLATDLAAEDSGKKDPKELKDRFSEMASRISIAPAGRPRDLFDFRAQPLLSWSNPTRRTSAGALFLWTASGRPQVALCVYPSSDQVIDLEFQSLSDDALTADSDEQLLWQPVESGVRWTRLDIAPPGRTPFARLRQMRLVARQFSSKLVPPEKNPIELRLLDTPVYRYDLSANKEKESDPSLIDGAVFTFVQGTDPEVLLLIEAHADGDKQEWRYALARMSIVPTQVLYDKTLVWETNWAIQRPSTPYYVYKSF